MVRRYVPLTEERIRAAIAARVCPWCAAGPFKCLALHTRKIHGVDRWELRDLAGLTTRESVCTPELSDTLRDAKPRKVQVQLALNAAAAARGKRAPRKLTRAGRAKLAENIGQPEWATGP